MPLTESRSVNTSNNVFYTKICMGNVKVDAFTHSLEAHERALD